MVDRLMNFALWVAVMALISAAAIGSLLLSYHGLLDAFARRYLPGGTAIGVGVMLAMASYVLARNANDLMDR